MSRIFDAIGQAPPEGIPSECAITIGNFDGVHLGHRALIQRAKEEAKARGLKLVIFTFCPHSTEVVAGRMAGRLYTDEQKAVLLKEQAPDAEIVFFTFDGALSRMTEDVFFEEILLKRYHARMIAVGDDFRYGYMGTGNTETLRRSCLRQGIGFCSVPGVMQNGERISSTRIRTLLAKGDVENAAALLGGAYRMEGTVRHGKRLGRKMGFPTVNLYRGEQMAGLRHGVYITDVTTPDGIFRGVTNVGVNPTVDQGNQIKAETHLLHYSGDLYGRNIQLAFLRWRRDEKRFASIEQLREQLQLDIAEAERDITAAGAAEWRTI